MALVVAVEVVLFFSLGGEVQAEAHVIGAHQAGDVYGVTDKLVQGRPGVGGHEGRKGAQPDDAAGAGHGLDDVVGRLRGWSQTAAALAWEAMTGAVLALMASRLVRIPAWAMSTAIRCWFIAEISAWPNWLSPALPGSQQPSPAGPR